VAASAFCWGFDDGNATGAGLVLTPATPLGRGRITADPILSLTTPQGAAATCDIYVMGFAVI